MKDSNTPSQERDGQADASQSDTVETAETDRRDTAGARDSAETPATSAGGDTDEDPQVAAAFEEADAALTVAAEAHDDYREAITDAVVALDEVARLEGREVPDESSGIDDEFAGIDTEALDAAAAPEHTDGTGHLELYHAGQVVVRAARTLKRSREFPQERAMGLVQTTARASIHLCHEDVPDDELADVATEAIEGVGDLAEMTNDEAVAEAATELFEILSKVEEVRAASEVQTDGRE
jgi:hypothetical protein